MKKLLALFFCLYASAVQAESVPVLMFHHIESGNGQAAHEVVRIERFEEYLKMLNTEGYTTVTMSELGDMIKRKHVPAKTVALTFDDGWDSNIEAVALLDKYKMKGTLYILSGTFESSEYLTKDELIALSKKKNIEIGAHTHTHLMQWGPEESKLDTMSNETMIGEMYESKVIIEQVIGRKIYAFAWPFGYIRPAARDLAPVMGFTTIAETNKVSKNTAETSPLQLQRLNIAGTCSPAQVKGMIQSGNLDPCK